MRQQNNYIPPELMQKIIDHVPDLNLRKWDSVDVQMVFKIAYWCALRLGKAIQLSAEDFDLERSDLYLGLSKKKKNVKVTIPQHFIPELEEYLADKRGPLLKNCHPRNPYKWLLRLGKMLDIKALTTPQETTGEKTKMHIFRKSVAKDMFWGTHNGKKAPMNLVSAALTHSNVETTSKYLKLDNEAVKDYWCSISSTSTID